MGIAGSSIAPPSQRCSRCKARWKQKGGLCRACWRADQERDPVHKAVQTVRHYIARGYVQAGHLALPARQEFIQRVTDAENALDLIAERLRDHAPASAAVGEAPE
jgi:hypothetical protein